MCTVTFIPVSDRYYITSNRDESKSRKQAIPPLIYNENEKKIIYPKDADAGGTWIALCENGKAAVLLNGAFEKHESKKPYQKSRGIVFLEIISAERPVRYFMRTDLEGIEPFTTIIMDKYLYECRWNGITKHCGQQNKNKPHIWSSVTLYDKETIKKREQWFEEFLTVNSRPTQEEIVNFHEFGGTGNPANDLKMNRNNRISTVSISSILLDDYRSNMKYLDLQNNKLYHNNMNMMIPNEYAEIF